ncbi:hypothetical protein [Novosphingobium sp.]|uniref:hypothetical protein n=1 Tax=Novosphingobium sp. TaxID=1874826 RepID=UPI003B51A319
MTIGKASADNRAYRKISAWQIVAAAWLHFAVPIYVVAMPVTALMVAPAGAPFAAMLTLVPRLSMWFLGSYAGLGVVCVTTAMAVEPLLHWRSARREASDPNRAALASARRVARAIADGTNLLGGEPAALLSAMRDPRWDHADTRFQALSTDLAEVVRTTCAALATASADRRAAIVMLATTSLRRIATALTALQAEQSRLDEGDAQAIARYVAMRYDTPDIGGDFAGDEH